MTPNFVKIQNPQWKPKLGSGMIVLVGASASGKSSLLRAARSLASNSDSSDLEIPVRFTTRDLRADDEAWENQYMTHAAMLNALESKELFILWKKVISDDCVEHYAFGSTQGKGPRLMGGNEALIDDWANIVPDPNLIADAVIVCTWCDESTRESRLMGRSPELESHATELAFRMKPASESVIEVSDILIDTSYAPPRDVAEWLLGEIAPRDQ